MDEYEEYVMNEIASEYLKCYGSSEVLGSGFGVWVF